MALYKNLKTHILHVLVFICLLFISNFKGGAGFLRAFPGGSCVAAKTGTKASCTNVAKAVRTEISVV